MTEPSAAGPATPKLAVNFKLVPNANLRIGPIARKHSAHAAASSTAKLPGRKANWPPPREAKKADSAVSSNNRAATSRRTRFAGVPAELTINAVEKINLHQHAHPARRLANAGRQLLVQPAFQGAAIRQPRQGIDARVFAQTPFQLKLPRPGPQTGEDSRNRRPDWPGNRQRRPPGPCKCSLTPSACAKSNV